MNSSRAYSERLTENINSFKVFVLERRIFFDQKPKRGKWSRKEIIGHLIDSARYNLMRFTEVAIGDGEFVVHPYDQDELVKINKYRDSDLNDLLNLWLSLNIQVVQVIRSIKRNTLKKEILLPDGSKRDLNFLIEDYIEHMEHHLKQLYSVSPS